MPLFFIIVGILLIVVAINNKLPELTSLVKDDFKPSNGSAGFAVWILAIFLVGAVGYYRPFKPISNGFLVLLFVVLIISNKGFISKFQSAIEQA